MENIANKLSQYSSPTPSRWREQAEERRANQGWLRHSLRIATAVLNRMEEMGLTQKALAEKLGCSQQYVSKMLKGRENLSLETICKLEDALGIHVLQEAIPT